MKEYRSIDLFKFICAVLIIILHTAPFASYSKVLTFGLRHIVTTIAVPFFFAASGFLTAKKLATFASEIDKNKYMKRFSLRLVVMYCIWSAIYFGFVIYKWYLLEDFSYLNIIEYIKDFFFEGSYLTIWFLPALLMAQVLVFLLNKKFSYKKIFIFAIPVYAFTLLGSSYYQITLNVGFLKLIFDTYYSFFDTIKNGVCFGFIYVALGAWISQADDKISRRSMKSDIVWICIFWILLAIEEVATASWENRGCDTQMMLVPLTYFVISALLKIELPEHSIYTSLRKYSLLMFLCQRIPLSIIELFLSKTILYTNSMLFFVVTMISTLVISFVVIKLSTKYKILKHMY